MSVEVRRVLLGSAWGACLGAIVTHYVTKKRAEDRANAYVDHILDYETEKLRQKYAAKYKEDEFATPETTAEHFGLFGEANQSDEVDPARVAIEDIIREQQYRANSDNFEDRAMIGRPDPGEIEQLASLEKAAEQDLHPDEMDQFDVDYVEPEDIWPNVTLDGEDDPKAPRRFEETIRPMNGFEVPYVISVDEFLDSNGNNKVSLTYYDGVDSQVLADERDAVISKITPLLGDDFLTNFGHRSGDKNIVYVRNERLEMDIEVVLNESSYEEVVLGIKPHRSRGGKFTEDDDA